MPLRFAAQLVSELPDGIFLRRIDEHVSVGLGGFRAARQTLLGQSVSARTPNRPSWPKPFRAA